MTRDGLPWDFGALVRNLARATDTLLDIGCGTAVILREIARSVRRIDALDCHEGRLAEAAENIRAWGITNIDLVRALSQRLPFADDSFDMVTCRKAPHDCREIRRVLKPGGWTVMEKVGERSYRDLKAAFGKDLRGWRGSFCDMAEGERQRQLQAEFAAMFRGVNIETRSYRRVFTSLAELVDLLERVHLVRDFDRNKDAQILQRLNKQFLAQGRIESLGQGILIQAQK
jgi:ubiquinone/menaquinone biosynthesis C-methylase UbiE